MTSVQEIKRAIESLSLADRQAIEVWVHDLGIAGHRIGERVAAYAVTRDFVSVETYLEQEALSDVRHEYINGTLYPMFGPSEAHARISGNLFAALHGHVRGKSCTAYIENFKVRIETDDWDVIYYPDIMVACTRDGVEDYFLRYPKLVVEVLSPSTESIDRREKLLSYKQIPTVEEYALLSQKTMQFTIHRRANRWRPEVVSGAEGSVDFHSLDFSISLAQIYEGLSL
jgi:Uma2 family endonuclease